MKVFDQKTNRNVVTFKEYELNGIYVCPECNRPFKDENIKYLEENGQIRCPKCGAKLKK